MTLRSTGQCKVCVDWKPRYLAMSRMRSRDSVSRITFFLRIPPRIVKQDCVWEARAVEAIDTQLGVAARQYGG
jgi:hypothetical protein